MKRCRLTTCSFIHYVPREIVALIESYVPLEDLSDSDQSRRVRKIAWPTTSRFEEKGQRTTAFEHHNGVFRIIHEGNFIHKIMGPQSWFLKEVYLWKHDSVCISSGNEKIVFRCATPFAPLTVSTFYLCGVFESEVNLAEWNFLSNRARWIVTKTESLLRVAEIILFHLHVFDKYAWC